MSTIQNVSITPLMGFLIDKIKLGSLFVLLIISCKNENCYFFENNDGLLIERFKDSLCQDIDENKYNNDNNIYTVGKKLMFEYSYEKNGIRYLYKQNGDEWSFIQKDSASSYPNTITQVIFEIANGNLMGKYIPDYNQTSIKYYYLPLKEYNVTGLVENEKNIWMHPPRQSLFRILELNPFPYIKLPLKVGTKWDWKLKIGDHWADERWKLWNGPILNTMNYEITDYRKVHTVFGNLDCYVVTANAKSEIGNTCLTAFFNKKYGFVRLDYTNIDNSTLKLILTNIENK